MKSTNAETSVVSASSAQFDLVTGTTDWGPVYVNPTRLNNMALIAQNFETYKLEQMTVHYTPSVGTTTSGKVWVGYTDNPEIIYKIGATYSASDILNIVKVLKNNAVYPVWQKWSMSVPQVAPRRKMFSIDVTAPGNAEVADRAVHGAFIVAIEGTPAATNVGVITATSRFALRGLQLQSLTGV